MQNHHSLIYREEEREMFPTLNVSTALPLLLDPLRRLSVALRCVGHPVVVAGTRPAL